MKQHFTLLRVSPVEQSHEILPALQQ